jgi:DNA-binding PadR family transcriptional regulator
MSETTETGPSWRNPLTLVAGGLLLIHMLLRYAPTFSRGWPENGGIDAVALGLAVIALVPWIADFLSGAKLPGGIEVAFRAVERRQRLNEDAIAQLRFIVEGFVTRDEYNHLLNIRRNIEYEIKTDQAESLYSELRRLRTLGLIEGWGLREFVVADGKKRRIGDTFRLTSRGNEYLAMREFNERLGQPLEPKGKPG